jgi:hypothetical protein
LIRVVLASALALPGLAVNLPAAQASTLSIRVVGNHFVNQGGQTIRLLGVDRSGAEYECVDNNRVFDGPSNTASVKTMTSWHINAVRVPLNEDCWLGINGVTTSRTKYRNAIINYVATLQSFGLYVILDLHLAAPATNIPITQWPMADADHSPRFWKSVAATFKSNDAVLFDLYNEPYISTWPCWLHGCQAIYDNNGSNVTYQTAGMQELVNAVRSTGATTPLMLGGLAWSNDETSWQTYEPVDRDHQLVVSFHTYNWNGCNNVTCWNSTIAPLAKVVPVVTGEFGESGCADSYDLSYMPWADQNGVSYLGWTWDATDENWNCSGGPALIVNYNGAPTAYGVGLRDHLAMLAAAG